jgi:hypothetical protein
LKSPLLNVKGKPPEIYLVLPELPWVVLEDRIKLCKQILKNYLLWEKNLAIAMVNQLNNYHPYLILVVGSQMAINTNKT